MNKDYLAGSLIVKQSAGSYNQKSLSNVKAKSTDKFLKLMQKDWNSEFAAVDKNLGKLNQRTKEEKELKKDPAAYMQKIRKKDNKLANKAKPKAVHF